MQCAVSSQTSVKDSYWKMKSLVICLFLVASAFGGTVPKPAADIDFNAYIDSLLAFIKADVTLPSIEIPEIDVKANLALVSVEIALTAGVVSGAENEERTADAEVSIDGGVADVKAELSLNLEADLDLKAVASPLVNAEGTVKASITDLTLNLELSVDVNALSVELVEAKLSDDAKVDLEITTDPPVANNILELLTSTISGVITDDVLAVVAEALNTVFATAIANVKIGV